HEPDVVIEVRALEPRVLAPAVVGRDVLETLDTAREQAPPKRRGCDERDPQLAADGERVLPGLAVPQRVIHLERRYGIDLVSPAERRRRRLAEPEGPDLALLTESRHGADRLLDGNLGVHTMLVVEVDRVDTESLEARVARASNVRRAPVDEVPAAVWTAHLAELGREHDAMAA